MQPLEPPTGRNLRLAAVSVAVLVLLAIVAFASRSGLGHTNHAQPTPGYVSYAFTAFLILFVLANFGTMVFFALIAIVVIYIKRHHGHIFGDNNPLKNVQNTLNNAQAKP